MALDDRPAARAGRRARGRQRAIPKTMAVGPAPPPRVHPPHQLHLIEAGTSVADLIELYFIRHTHGGYPVERRGVERRGQVIGLVTLHELRGVPPDRRREVAVETIMVPLSADLTVDGETDVADTFIRMASTRSGRLLVLEGERLRGLVTLRGLAQVAQVRSALGGAPPERAAGGDAGARRGRDSHRGR
jgi:CBS domain-containing protein